MAMIVIEFDGMDFNVQALSDAEMDAYENDSDVWFTVDPNVEAPTLAQNINKAIADAQLIDAVSIPCANCGEPVFDNDVNEHIRSRQIMCDDSLSPRRPE